MLNVWPRNRLYLGPRRGPKVKTYTDGYRDALLDLKIEIEDNVVLTLADITILLNELLADLGSP